MVAYTLTVFLIIQVTIEHNNIIMYRYCYHGSLYINSFPNYSGNYRT